MTDVTTLIPPAELRFMNEDEERFVRQGRELAGQVLDAGDRTDVSILDIGSGYGRLAVGLIADGRHTGSYVGWDILGKHIGWCAENITPEHPRYEFKHVNAHNPRYNPGGTLDPDKIKFPVANKSADTAALFSVFTHLYRSNIEHYLKEIRRTLKPGGIAVTSWLLWDDERLAAVTGAKAAYPLVHELDAETRYSDLKDPLRAIGFTPRLVREMVESAGLKIRSTTLGSWDGVTTSNQFQDLVVIESPVRKGWFGRG
jgi:SAM-dependent methyltransferase